MANRSSLRNFRPRSFSVLIRTTKNLKIRIFNLLWGAMWTISRHEWIFLLLKIVRTWIKIPFSIKKMFENYQKILKDLKRFGSFQKFFPKKCQFSNLIKIRSYDCNFFRFLHSDHFSNGWVFQWNGLAHESWVGLFTLI